MCIRDSPCPPLPHCVPQVHPLWFGVHAVPFVFVCVHVPVLVPVPLMGCEWVGQGGVSGQVMRETGDQNKKGKVHRYSEWPWLRQLRRLA
eukprot:9325372-Alexandrium_andersonii.AAC.1